MSWRKSTFVWLSLIGIAAVLFVGGSFVSSSNPLMPLGVLLAIVAGTVIGIRAAVFVAQKLFYRLSLRLAFSYLLIGVFPVPLLVLLIGVAAAMSLGQFEAYRVDQAVRQLGAQIRARGITGVQHARLSEGKIVSSEVAALPEGGDAPPWVGELKDARFVGVKGAEILAVASTRAGETRVQ